MRPASGMYRATVYLIRNNATIWEGRDADQNALRERCENECQRVRELYFQFVIHGGERTTFEEMLRRSRDLVNWRLEWHPIAAADLTPAPGRGERTDT